MSDNVVLNSGSGGDTLAADDIAGVKYQRIKLVLGADNTNDGDVASGNPLPVTGTVTANATLAAETTKVIGTVNVAAAQSIAVTNAGTFATQAAQAGTWTVQPGNTANTTAWKVDGSAVTQPVSGTVTINAIPAGNNNIGDVDVASIAAGNNNIGDVDIASIAAGDNNIGNVDIVSLPASTNTLEVVGDAAQDDPVSGNPVAVGLRGSTATPTGINADGDVVYGWSDRKGATVITGRLTDDTAFTPATDRVVPIAFQADETATDSVDEGDAGCPRMTLDRKVIFTPYTHAAAGGHTPYKNLDCDESEDDIKTSAGKLFWINAINLATAKRYLKFYNATAANTTVGTTVPVLTFPLPSDGTANGSGFTLNFGDAGVQFDTAICVAATTGFADNDSGAPGTNDVILNCGYL